MAFPESRPTAASETLPVCATPVTTARMIRPEDVVHDRRPEHHLRGGVLEATQVGSTRAVMPTLVAVNVAPTKTASSAGWPSHDMTP